jgi:hypothetical protein
LITESGIFPVLDLAAEERPGLEDIRKIGPGQELGKAAFLVRRG